MNTLKAVLVAFLFLIFILGVAYAYFVGIQTSSPQTSSVTPMQTSQQILASGDFTLVYNPDYNQLYCNKINPYDLSVRKAASDAVASHPGSYSLDQVLDIYDWVKNNINYLNVPVTISAPYPPNETLYTKSGDCKNQAVLIASMVNAIGGTARVLLDPTCKHAYAIVFMDYINQTQNTQSIIDGIAAHYNQQLRVNYLRLGDANWLIFDPAGGNYPGNTLPECSGNRTIYETYSCISAPQ